MNKDKYYILFLWFVIIFITICFTIKCEIDRNEINKIQQKVKEQYIKIHDYEWQTQQYEYMFDKYCGGMNNKNN